MPGFDKLKIDITVEVPIKQTTRVKQLSAMFDVPPTEKLSRTWKADIPLDKPWNVGLIVGPSGAGKSTILRETFGGMTDIIWSAASVVDDFAAALSMERITGACSAVGFNTIPSWAKPHGVLSNGERFRVDLARRLLEMPDPIVVDEFTSVVDRQVAQIGAYAVQKFIRKHDRKFVAATCHYDVIDWLQPDWILEPATMTFQWRSVQRRPDIACTIGRVPYAAWGLFAPFHYLTAELHRGARCFVLFVGDRPAAFAGMLHRPHATAHDIMGCSRLVTLPDFQGLGLAFALIDRVSAAYKAIGKRVHTYPAHPALIRGFDKSGVWTMQKRPGTYGATMRTSPKSTLSKKSTFGGRPCAVFEYAGPGMDRADAERLMAA